MGAALNVADPFHVTEWDLYSREPESLNVGQLNRAVRRLREDASQRPAKARAQGIEWGLLLAARILCCECRAGHAASPPEPYLPPDPWWHGLTTCPASAIHDELFKLTR